MELFNYQKTGVRRLANQSLILGDDMGLGKTVQAVVAMRLIGVTTGLVVCPLTMVSTWADTIRKWYPELEFKVWNGKIDLPKFGICHYEVVDPTKFERKRVDVLIIDEAQKIKNRKSGRSIKIKKISQHADKRWLLTGTPIMNRPAEIWHLLHVAAPTVFTSYWVFVKEHLDAKPGKWGWVISETARNPTSLAKAIEPYYLRRDKSVVRCDLPKVTRQVITCPMSDRQQKLHEQVSEALLVECENGNWITIHNVLVRTTRLRQIAVSPQLMEPEETDIGGKYDALKTILANVDRAVVFSQWSSVLFTMAAKLRADKEISRNIITIVHGGMSPSARDNQISAWRNNGGYLFITQGVGGVGLTLTESCVGVLVDESWNPSDNEQCIGRLDRHGQTMPVNIYTLRTENSIEEEVADHLNDKIAMVEAINAALKRITQT